MADITFQSAIYQLNYLNTKYLLVPKAVVEQMGGMKQRIICVVNGQVSYQSGFMALSEGNAYISINAQRMKKLKVELGDEVNVELKKDDSKYGMPLPEELEEVFLQDTEGFQRFEQLTPGKQRYIIGYVAGVKNTDKRIERALLLISNLKLLPKGKETMRGFLGLPER